MRTAWAAVCACVAVAAAQDSNELAAMTRVWPSEARIDAGWSYAEVDSSKPPAPDEAAWVPVDLPHTWNAEDTLRQRDYRRGSSWYRRELDLRPAAGERLYLRFGAAGRRARVLVNGVEVGAHVGGYAAFTVEITQAVRPGANVVEVWVNNEADPDVPPLDIDHNIYGGLYRGVALLRSPGVALSRIDRGGPGVRVWSPEVSALSATLRVSVRLDNGTPAAATRVLTATLTDAAGRAVSFGTRPVEVPPGQSSVELALPAVVAPSLWSPSTPTLYRLRVELWDEKNIRDSAEVWHGFRWFGFDAERGFMLNGERVFLKGMNRHQDLFGSGNAVTPEHHARDMALIKEIGANAVRLAHYQQDDVVLALCDRLGLLVWEEIPVVNAITPSEEFASNAESMLRDMVTQHVNHPSVVVWGLQNEFLLQQNGVVDTKDGLYAAKAALLSRLHAAAKTLDPTRATGVADHGVPWYAQRGLHDQADVVGYNTYYGWYVGAFADFGPTLSSWRAITPGKPHVLTEFGAGSDLRIQRERPVKFDFSEQWQCAMIESHLDQAEAMPWLAGVFYWNMFDFGAAHRGDTIPHVNKKGTVTFDRAHRKDAFFLFKSRWSDEPVVYLASPRLSERVDAAATFRGYTNADTAELFLNGVSQGAQREGFSWNVTLRPGENTLLLVGRHGDEERRHGYVTSLSAPAGGAAP